MQAENLVKIGFIKNTHSYKGELKFQFSLVHLKKGSKLDFLFIGTSAEQAIPYPIEKLSLRNDGLTIIKLSGIDTELQAKKIIGQHIFIDNNLLKKQKGYALADLIEYRIVDTKLGDIGQVVNVMDNKMQQLLVVKYKKQELFIPFIEKQIIIKINEDEKIIDVSLPEGLLDIYI